MAIGPRLDLRQSQTLVMTPQLQQAIKLLQMSSVELSEYIDQEIEQNPLLEREGGEGGLDAERADADRSEDPVNPSETALADGFGDEFSAVPDSADHAVSESIGDSDRSLDTDYENVYEPESASDGAPANGAGEGDSLHWSATGASYNDELSGLGNIAAGEMSLREHLFGQINVDFNDPVDRMIAGNLIDLLDEAGWFDGDTDQVAQALACPVERVEETLARCQTLDPPGIFARGLAECLALQLRERNRLDPAMATLLENLDLLANREFSQLRRLCGVDNDDLLEMVAEIKALNPKPASDFDHEVAQPVIPDVFVRRDETGWRVELNSDTMPRVLVNTHYHAIVRKHARSRDDKDYVADKFQSANWLVRALHQRAETILKVATEIVRQQEAFFDRGVEFLRPLTLRDVAETVGVHESTVSRVTANKYLGMSRGIYEMKYFFNSAIGRGDVGESKSAESIRFKIRSLIDRETPDTVLSDDRIVDILRDEGIDIARRTVAKYRDAMRIPSSVQRRREKSLLA